MGIETATERQTSLASIIRNYFLIAFLAWTAIIAALFTWDAKRTLSFAVKDARENALASYNKDVAFREWATTHGGVYVPVDETTPPNPYLADIKERDLTTPSGKQLTLMNPAYMARQINEFFAKKGTVFGHITSLRLKNPINKPDKWEEDALKAFEKGEQERVEVADIGGKPFLRLMRPMITKQGCLKCHASQGYKVGDIRGAVGVAVALAPYYAEARDLTHAHAAAHGLIWLLGSLGLWAGHGYARRIGKARDDAKDEAESALKTARESEEKAKLLLNSVGEAVYGIDLEGNCTFHNQACLRTLGYEEGTRLIGRNMHDLIHHTRSDGTLYPVKECKIYKAFKEGIGTHVDDEVLWRADGTSFPAEYRSFPILRDGTIIGSVVTFTDITERKRAEMQLVAAKEAAEEANRLKSEFLSNMTHELNTPLTSVLGYSRLANDRDREIAATVGALIELINRPESAGADWRVEAGALAKQAMETIQDISKFDATVLDQGQRLFHLLNDLMDLSMVESGQIKLMEQTVSTFMVLTSIERYYKDAARMKGLSFSVNASDFRPIDLQFAGDGKWLEKVIGNLVQNAIKFSGAGEIRVTAMREDTSILFRVSDEGVGIDERERKMLFEDLRQLDGSSTRPQGGIGLGLTLARKLVQAMGGEITVKSEIGKGSEFIVKLPYQPPAGSAAS